MGDIVRGTGRNEIVRNSDELSVPTIEDYRGITHSDFFVVERTKDKNGQWQERKEPSAKAWNYWGRKEGIKTKILDHEINENRARAKVCGWVGDFDNPREYTEAIVTLQFDVEDAATILEFIKPRHSNGKVCYRVKGRKCFACERGDTAVVRFKPEEDYAVEDGRIIPINSALQIDVIEAGIRLRRFGDREAVTKAESICFRKLLRTEWRENDEASLEEREINAVAESRGAVIEPDQAEKVEFARIVDVMGNWDIPNKHREKILNMALDDDERDKPGAAESLTSWLESNRSTVSEIVSETKRDYEKKAAAKKSPAKKRAVAKKGVEKKGASKKEESKKESIQSEKKAPDSLSSGRPSDWARRVMNKTDVNGSQGKTELFKDIFESEGYDGLRTSFTEDDYVKLRKELDKRGLLPLDESVTGVPTVSGEEKPF